MVIEEDGEMPEVLVRKKRKTRPRTSDASLSWSLPPTATMSLPLYSPINSTVDFLKGKTLVIVCMLDIISEKRSLKHATLASCFRCEHCSTCSGLAHRVSWPQTHRHLRCILYDTCRRFERWRWSGIHYAIGRWVRSAELYLLYAFMVLHLVYGKDGLVVVFIQQRSPAMKVQNDYGITRLVLTFV